jgi:hypothetical protein
MTVQAKLQLIDNPGIREYHCKYVHGCIESNPRENFWYLHVPLYWVSDTSLRMQRGNRNLGCGPGLDPIPADLANLPQLIRSTEIRQRAL